ncbi:MAG: nucleotide sugar dehydrogenase [Acidimicrobiia bacterium]|nr:nucleotide sugar dehydrogenase [Acidimicrobiia bacterium]
MEADVLVSTAAEHDSREGRAMDRQHFLEGIAARDLTIGVIGLGYVGLPLVIGFAEAGYRTVGFDVDGERVAAVNAGRSHIEDVATDRVAAMVAAGSFEASNEGAALAQADAVFIAVPTPFDSAKTPDLAYVQAAARTLREAIHPGMLVILQSTTYPGTTREIVQPTLEESGLRAGDDFWLAFSPERVDPGNPHWGLRNTPKLVGGIDGASTELAQALLESAMETPGLVTTLSSPEAAELAKLLENTYRAVNIALVNELAVLCHEMGIDLWEVIDGAGTKPFGFQAFYPGIGAGGHCIPVDPYYLSWAARRVDFTTHFIELAAETNLGMADYVVRRVTKLLNDQGKAIHGSRILCYGAAFKPNVADMRNSRAVRVMELLGEAGADLAYHDPRVPALRVGARELKSVELTDAELATADLVVLLVSHRELDVEHVLATAPLVFDAVNAAGRSTEGNLERL